MKAEDITKLVAEAFAEGGGEFRPCAFFDDRLDCIRVITKDCSILERRIGDRVTILLNNHDPVKGQPECVGFTIKGARHFCAQHGWNHKSPVVISELLNGVLESFPEDAVQVFIQLVAKPMLADKKIDPFEIPDELLATA